MNEYEKAIKVLQNEIIEKQKELKEWENFNEIENDLLRLEIKSKQKLINTFEKQNKIING